MSPTLSGVAESWLKDVRWSLTLQRHPRPLCYRPMIARTSRVTCKQFRRLLGYLSKVAQIQCECPLPKQNRLSTSTNNSWHWKMSCRLSVGRDLVYVEALGPGWIQLQLDLAEQSGNLCTRKGEMIEEELGNLDGLRLLCLKLVQIFQINAAYLVIQKYAVFIWKTWTNSSRQKWLSPSLLLVNMW